MKGTTRPLYSTLLTRDGRNLQARNLPRTKLGPSRLMTSSSSSDLYSPREIALAAGVSEAVVRAQMTREGYLRHDAAVALGRRLIAQIRHTATREPATLFAIVSADGSSESRRVIAQLA